MRSRTGAAVLAVACAMAVVGAHSAWGRSPKERSPLLGEPVTTSGGRLSGVPGASPGVAVFKGIPYAAPPLGELRWQPPQPAASWHGDFAGDRYGPACIQPRQAQRTPKNTAVDLPGSPPMSEDCLYLNVWTAAPSARAGQPVMVFIYGGGFTEGAGSTPSNQGDALAAQDVVVVTFNYRLGALGFMAHPALTAQSPHKSSGNYALQDALAALQWVQKNIKAFGGDPANVTIFGEAEGAAMCAALAGSPQAAGLFQRVIAQSGTWMGPGMAPMRTLAAAEQDAVKAAAALGATSLAALRALPAQEAAARLALPGVIIDGWIVPEDLSRTFAQHRQNKVDVLAGSNRDEGAHLAAAPDGALTPVGWKAAAAQRWGAQAELGLKAYPAGDDAQAAAARAQVIADELQWSARLLAASPHALGRHAFAYYFAHEPPYADSHRLGACQGCELPYVFDHLTAPRPYPNSSSPEMAAASAAERELARVMSAYWVNFARTGDPNGRNLPRWPAFNDAAKGPVLQIADPMVPGDPLGDDKATLYRTLYERQLPTP